MKGPLRWFAALLLISIPVFLIVMFVFRDFVRESIVIPVVYMFWIGGMILNSVPNMLYMEGLVIFGMMMAVGSLRYLLQVSRLPTESPMIIEEPTRFQFWNKRCQKVNTSTFFLTSLGIELRRFVLMVLAYQEHRDMWHFEREIIEKEFEVPPVVYDLISQRNLGDVPQEETSLWQALLARLFGSSQTPDALPPVNSLRQRLDQITNFLEYRLEVKHDRRDS